MLEEAQLFFITPTPWLGVCCFIAGLHLYRAVGARLLASLFSFVFENRIPALQSVIDEAEDFTPLNRWWACIARSRIAPRCQEKAAALQTLHRVRELRRIAERQYFAEKLDGHAAMAPMNPFFGGFDSWWVEINDEERLSFLSLSFTTLWHVMTVTLAFLSPQAALSSAQLTWASNVGDLILIAMGWPNANAARRVSQLVQHHLTSAIGIPLVLCLCDPPVGVVFRYQLYLELTGGLSALLSAIQFTPLRSLSYVLHLVSLVVFVVMRGPLWALLLVDVVSEAPSFTAVVIAAGAHLAMLSFNWFFLGAWWKRTAAVTYSAGSFLPRWIGALWNIAVAYGQSQEGILFVVLYVVPVAFAILSPGLAVATVAAALFGAYRAPAKPVRTARVTLTSFEQVREVLRNQAFSPIPHRYMAPKPLVAPFASWVKGMLLYSPPGDHARLKQSYPPLNDPVFVRDQFAAFVQQSVSSLLLPLRGHSKLEFMGAIGHVLPWVVMQRVAGIPIGDVPRAAELIRTLGDFVGKPITPELLRKAMDAQSGMLELIAKWRKLHERMKPTNSVADGALTFWEQHSVFATTYEYEANVVMLLFAGTHNLENVLGHAVRLLLQNPEQLELLRADTSHLSSVVEETLRVCPPIQLIPRTALTDVSMSWGQEFSRGETVLLDVLSANRECENPEAFILNRKDRKHVAFGFGSHICNGSSLGREETKEVVRQLLVQGVLGSKVRMSSYKADTETTYATLQELHLSFDDCTDVVRVVGVDGDQHPFVLLAKGHEFSFDVVVEAEPSRASDYLFAFCSMVSLDSDSLSSFRNTVGRDCFKVAVVMDCAIPMSHQTRLLLFEKLKRFRFNLFAAPGAGMITPECGLLPWTSQDWRTLLSFAMQRKNVRWFATDRLLQPPPSDAPALKGCRLLLDVAHGAHLFTGALDPTSGNVSFRSTIMADALWVSPRQVHKPSLRSEDFCLVWREGEQRVLKCCVPAHLGSDVKSSIDSGMLSALYGHFGGCECCLHFHYGGVLVRKADAVTSTAFPCGALEEALEVIRVCGVQQPPFLVELVHHGYLLVLEAGGSTRLRDEWEQCLRESRFPLLTGWDISEDRGCEPSVPSGLAFPIFDGPHIVGLSTLEGTKRLTWILTK